MMATGTVKPPEDLRPAIDKLGPEGRKRLADYAEENNGKIEPWMIARAADHERGECG